MTLAHIKREIDGASAERKRVAMFHLQVLLNAGDLDGVDSSSFCEQMGMSKPFATEFRKMISLARLLKGSGYEIMKVK